MASAIFVVPLGERGPVLPETLLADSQADRGWACIGQVPQAPTALVRVWATDAYLDDLAAQPDYLYVEDVDDGAET